jgi:hypothetical protein
MSRRRNKKGQYASKGGRKKNKRKSSKRRAAAASMKRDAKGHFIGKKGRRKGSKKRNGRRRGLGILGAKQAHRSRRHASQASANVRALTKAVASQFVAKGYTEKQARVLAKRYIRMQKHRAARAAAGPTSEERVAAAMKAAYSANPYAGLHAAAPTPAARRPRRRAKSKKRRRS